MKNKNKHISVTRIISLVFSLVFILSAAVVPILAEEKTEEDIYAVPIIDEAPFIYLYNFENDTVLYEKGDLNLPIYPTSTVKIMAGITAIEALGKDRQRKITVTEEMLNTAGNKVGFKVGEVVTAEQMLYSMLVNSANDAALILAHAVAGSVDEFVDMMNKKAFEIGARSTSYTNPTGMHHDSMYTTTADTITIAKYAYNIPYFMEIVSTPMYLMEETNLTSFRKIYNRNCLMSKYYRADYYYENALGMNAGHTLQGGYSSVSVARNSTGDLTYLCVIMNAKSVETENSTENNLINYSGAIKMFDWAFRSHGYIDILSPKSVVTEVPVGLSSTSDYVTLVPKETISVFLPTNTDIKKEIKITCTTTEDIKAPVKKGDVMGYAKVMKGDIEVGRVELIATADIERNEFLFTLERISDFTKSKFFIATAVSIVVLSAGYILIQARLRQKRLRSRLPRQYRK